jgi:hypothetical protein
MESRAGSIGARDLADQMVDWEALIGPKCGGEHTGAVGLMEARMAGVGVRAAGHGGRHLRGNTSRRRMRPRRQVGHSLN